MFRVFGIKLDGEKFLSKQFLVFTHQIFGLWNEYSCTGDQNKNNSKPTTTGEKKNSV